VGESDRRGSAPRVAAVPEATPARLTVSPLPRRAGLRAAGEVDLVTRATWTRALEHAVHEGEDVLHLELAALTFVDVAGAGVLAETVRRLPPGRRIVLHQPPSALSRILQMFWPGLPGIEVSPS
jgi:anti-anti-sigma factor